MFPTFKTRIENKAFIFQCEGRFSSWFGIFQLMCFSFWVKIESVVVSWMNLEPLIQSEACHKEKNKYPILMHIHMESRKMALVNLVGNKLVDTAREGEGGMN